jgi:AcrR family transcriptional regulator
MPGMPGDSIPGEARPGQHQPMDPNELYSLAARARPVGESIQPELLGPPIKSNAPSLTARRLGRRCPYIFPGDPLGKNSPSQFSHVFALDRRFRRVYSLNKNERTDGLSKRQRMDAMDSLAYEKPQSSSRDGILHAALQLFSKRGYDATSIDDIRQAAGFKSKASLYTHFKSKEEIASALLQEILEQEDRVVMQAYHAADPETLHRFLAVGKAFLAWVLSHPQEVAFCLLRVQQDVLIQGKLPYMGERPLSAERLLLELFHELRKTYPVRPIADAALLTMIVGMVSRAAIDQAAFGAVNQEERVEQIMEVCLGLLFCEPVPLPTE